MSNIFENVTTTGEEDAEVEVKKMGKRGKSNGKRSKSKKSIDFQNNREEARVEDYDDEQKLERASVLDNELKQQRKLLISTTMSTKKSGSQQQQAANGQQMVSTQVNNNHNHNKLSQRQVKLNYFINHNKKKGELSTNNTAHKNNNNSTINQSLHKKQGNTTSKYAMSQFQRKQSSLQKQLKEKETILERMKLEREIHLERFNKLKFQSEEYKVRCRETMQKQLREFGRVKRQEKAQINPRFGYYRQAGWTVFVEGEIVLSNKKKLQELQQRIQVLETKKRSCSAEQKHLITAQIDHLSKELTIHKEDMKRLELIVTQYKERLRLADKEQSCTMSKHDWNIVLNRYLPLELLGSGGFGEVYKAYDLETNMYVAIKVNCFQPNKNTQFREEFLKHVQRQVATLKELNHPNIVKLIDEILIDDKISFVLEYCTGPELSKYLVKNEHLLQHQARAIIKQVSYALRYMFNQRHRVIHYDLKPANIMFHNGCVKILDFGLCKKMQTQDTKIDLTSQGVGTYWYLPPQTFMDGAEISSKVDVWSMGVIFYELLYGKRPFGHGIGQNRIYQDGIILKALKVDFPTDKKYKVSEAAKDFIRECLKYNHEERLDPQQVYNHEYLAY